MNQNRERRRESKYVDLKNDGRLFPSYIMANFKEFKLDEIILDPSVDPCKPKEGMKRQLKKYQAFLSKYMNFMGPYNDILIYHGLGSGKTASAIGIYNMLYNYDRSWNVYILIKASLKDDPWLKDLEAWLDKSNEDYIFSNSKTTKDLVFRNIKFISYDSPIADKQFMDIVKNADSSKKSLYIIDEVHNFIRNVYSNVTSKQGRRASVIYDHILRDKRDNPDTRTILCSFTPVVNKPFELALLFNLLRPNIFPKSESQFNQMYVSSNGSRPLINPAYKNNFQRRILGLVSYYIGATADNFASIEQNYVEVEMSEYQIKVYEYFKHIEEEKAIRMAQRGSKGTQEYMTYTRQACNFVFPNLSQKVTGETRPRPSKFKLKDAIVTQFEAGKIEKSSKQYHDVAQYFNATKEFVELFVELLRKKSNQDDKEGLSISSDYKNYIEKLTNDSSYTLYKFASDESIKKSNLFWTLYNSSPKMLLVTWTINQSKGPAIVYSNFVIMEGIQLFKVYLDFNGYSEYSHAHPSSGKNGFRYIEYHGGIDRKIKKENLKLFNKPENNYGEICKVVLISPAVAEGVGFMSIRQIHLMEPYWHETRMIQIAGRGRRQCSHKTLPMEERHIDIYRYKSVYPDREPITTDQFIENKSRSKEELNQSFLNAMKEAAVDCELNKNVNMAEQNYQCFQFEEDSLFDKLIGPAYREKLEDDVHLNNGLNSLTSKVLRVKVIKIKAVILLSDTEDKYGESTTYWYNPDTQVVYDFDMKYPIGKVGVDNIGLPLKLNEDVYIINQVINIPMLSVR